MAHAQALGATPMPVSFRNASQPRTGSRPAHPLPHSLVLERIKRRRGRAITRTSTIARNVPVPPSNVGPKTFPDYEAFTGPAIRLKGGGLTFAGQRDDPFYLDLGARFDSLNIRSGTGNAGGGKDDFQGMNTSSIVLQVPEAQVTRNRRAVSAPDGDAKRYGSFVLKPELAAILNQLFNVNAPENNRTDLVQALLQGLPGLNEHSGFAKGKAPAVDALKLNLGTPPAATENRVGVIGGDMAGFPNGRRLGDDVPDIALQVVAGFLKGNEVPLGDGVDRNDKPFLETFP